jgi:hypothetical protein
LKDSYGRGYLMIVSSTADQREIPSEKGLVSGHSFEIMAMYEFEQMGELVRLIKLRNPWGYSD